MAPTNRLSGCILLFSAYLLAAEPQLRVKLTQRSPVPGGETAYATSVDVYVSRDKLVFEFRCTDPQPSRIAVHTMQRDAEMEGDDTVAVVLDPYGDGRTGYSFRVNAAGARADGLISGPEEAALNWDGIWDARTSRDGSGWTAVITIPARSLNFNPKLTEWGLNLERAVPRDQTIMRWSSPTLDSFLPDLSRAGRLPGVEILRQGSGWEFSPFVVGRERNSFAEGGQAWQAQMGADITWHVTPQLAAVFTANTDFAETEVDSRQLNVTRFPLFYPEKRAFFLEGSNQFEFGLGLGTNFIPFFSRRVGLLGGNQIPIDGGVKLNGRVGRWNVGLLDVQTRDSRFAPGVNLFAARVSYDVTPKLRLGTLVTNGDPTGLGRNTLAGFDGVWRTSKFLGNKNLLIGGWTAFSRRDKLSGNRGGWGYKVDYPNDLWDCYAQTHQYGEALNPGLGFLPRPGSRQYATGCTFSPRPARDGPLAWIRKYYLRNYYTRVDNLKGYNESWQYQSTPLQIQFNSGDEVELRWTPQHEFLALPFEIAPGVIVPSGSYTFQRVEGTFESSPHRPVNFVNSVIYGGFYSGTLLQQESGLGWTAPKGRFQSALIVNQNFGRLREGSFVQRLWMLNLVYSFSPNMSFNSLLQYDNESSNFGANTRLRWTVKPGNDIFLVWNRGWKRLYLSPREIPMIPESELVALKIRWTFRP